MFVHESRLRHLLRPEHYRDPDHYQLELETLFRTSWQLACTKQEISKKGDFVTVNHAGTPVILRNFGNEIKAFVNVCPHRHSQLTCEPNGNSEKFKCQYHGWEFNSDGSTGRIPEAHCFRPWDRENSHLQPIRMEMCGDLIFINLSNGPETLKDFIGEKWDEIEANFKAPMWRMAEEWEFDANSNWKVPVENTLDSYHIAEVHPDWFDGELPLELHSIHHLEDSQTRLEYAEKFPWAKEQFKTSRFLGGEPKEVYRHYHFHPSLIVVMTDTINYVSVHVPTSPTTVRVKIRMFALHGTRNGPLRSIVRYVAWRMARKSVRQIFNEDRVLYEAQQLGIQGSNQPGVIGVREERIWQFQKWLLETTGIGMPKKDQAQIEAGIEAKRSTDNDQANESDAGSAASQTS
ncbi:Anthranilate 1,2-dioxygenase large subunit [Rubripirellula obstinata]|uniref:Anthranilate 1,2-dioxygenase large subunit n=1 Tax=Rubripirellula obstinata TaxID=406547 RepID=A0A5B1CKK0_9BACT|nr:aromatic ring-hydroxylating dioxygenase subunit alpha [Rubripirellula obstinata]KAA1261086.1 Anthranilate 1,2-dioxygenase large subunit [Rubripirellula obstinata]